MAKKPEISLQVYEAAQDFEKMGRPIVRRELLKYFGGRLDKRQISNALRRLSTAGLLLPLGSPRRYYYRVNKEKILKSSSFWEVPFTHVPAHPFEEEKEPSFTVSFFLKRCQEELEFLETHKEAALDGIKRLEDYIKEARDTFDQIKELL